MPDKRPVWDRKPKLRPGRVKDLFGSGAKVVRRGDGKYTVSGSDRNFNAPAPTPEPFGGFTRRQALPDNLIGVDDVIGRFRRAPRVNPADYVTHRVPERLGGGFFAEKRNDLTGLDPQFRSDIGRFDQKTDLQRQRIEAANAEAVQRAQGNAAANAEQLTGLAELQGVGHGQATDPTALAQAQSRTRGAAAEASPEVARLGDLPTTIESSGRGVLEDFISGREEARTETIQAKRQSDAEEAFERLKMETETNLQLRGQQTELLSQILSAQNAQNLEQLRQEGSLEELTRQLNFQAGELENDNIQAGLDRSSSEGIAALNAAQRDRASQRSSSDRAGNAADKRRDKNLKSRQKFLDKLDEAAFEEIRVSVPIPGGGTTSTTERQPRANFNFRPVLQYGLNQGLTPEGVVRLFVSAGGSAMRNAENLGELWNDLGHLGVNTATRRRIWKRVGLPERNFNVQNPARP